MTFVDMRHYATVSHGRIMVGVQIWRTGPRFQRELLYDAGASLSLDEARRAVEAVKDPDGFFRSEDGRLTVWSMEYRLGWLSNDNEGIVDAYCLGSDCWSAEFVSDIKHAIAILEAEAGE